MLRVLFIVSAVLISGVSFGQISKVARWEKQGDTAMSRQQYGEAIKIYTKIIEKTKLRQREDFAIVYKRAVCYYYTEDYKRALSDLNQVVPKFPNLPQARMLRALTHKELGDNENKLKDLELALDGDPANADMLTWRASIYLDDDEFALAKKDLKVARLFKQDAEIEMYMGVAQYNTGAVDSAFQSLDKAIELDATYLPSYLYATSFCLGEDKYEKALEYLDYAGRLEPDNMSVLFYKGIALVELQRVDEGCRYLRKAFYGGMDDASGYLKENCFGFEN